MSDEFFDKFMKGFVVAALSLLVVFMIIGLVDISRDVFVCH